jgi:hypothetical protein
MARILTATTVENRFFQSTADFYDDTPETWFGSWRERRHFQPAVLKSLLNILIDSDITSVETDKNGDMVHRCDGILPHITTKTKLLTHFFKLTLNPAVDPFPLEQQLSAIKYTKGELTTINESSESGKNVIFPNWIFSTGREETRDAYGDPGNATEVEYAEPPVGYVDNDDDCDDANAAVNPEVEEICDDVDNNCNGETDEGVVNTYYADSDGDGHGNAGITT